MPKSPERAAEDGGDAFRDILLNSLAEIEKVEAGIIPEEPAFVTTSKGMVQVLPATADFIRSDLEAIWSGKYPGLFEKKGS